MPEAFEPIRVEGLADLSRSLRKLDSDLPKALRVALNKPAELVIGEARPRIPKRTGRAANSLKAKSTRTEVRVSEGGSRAPYMPWLDFGGRVGRGRSIERRFYRDGRYLYASYYDLVGSGKIQDVLSRSLLDVVESAGLEVD